MASGVGVPEDTKTKFQELLKDRKYIGITLKMSSDLTEVIVESVKERKPDANPEEEYKAFVDALPENDCRYYIYDFEYENQGIKKSRVVLVTWSPEDSPVRSKMMYSSSKQALENTLGGLQTKLQATDFDEASYKTIRATIVGSGVSY